MLDTIDGEDDDQDIPVAVPDVVKEGALLLGAGVSASSMRICLLDTSNGPKSMGARKPKQNRKHSADIWPPILIQVLDSKITKIGDHFRVFKSHC